MLFHLLEDGVLLDLDEVPAFLLGETKPEFLDAFAFLCCAGAPDLVSICLAFLTEKGCVPGLAGVGGWGRRVAILSGRGLIAQRRL